jgi:POT family proton-dependent oligopeptide transporter
MNGHGIPNDFMQNFDAMSIIVFVPMLDKLIYPALRKVHINFRPITRITFGFLVAASSMAYAAALQHYIYKSPPCFDKPLTCQKNAKGVEQRRKPN